MLPTQHAALSALAVAVVAPVVKKRRSLALFWIGAVGQDVDHYLWYVWRYRNLSLRSAYKFFRSRYGQPWRESGEPGNARTLHGPVPLGLALLIGLVFPVLRPAMWGVAFHGLLDAWNEYVVMPEHQSAAGPPRSATVTTPPDLSSERRAGLEWRIRSLASLH